MTTRVTAPCMVAAVYTAVLVITGFYFSANPIHWVGGGGLKHRNKRLGILKFGESGPWTRVHGPDLPGT